MTLPDQNLVAASSQNSKMLETSHSLLPVKQQPLGLWPAVDTPVTTAQGETIVCPFHLVNRSCTGYGLV